MTPSLKRPFTPWPVRLGRFFVSALVIAGAAGAAVGLLAQVLL